MAGLTALFSSARRRNGFRGLHEILSGTQTERRRSVVSARTKNVRDSQEEVPRPEAVGQLGPYSLLRSLYRSNGQELFLGYDGGLRRHVWITVSTGRQARPGDARRLVSRPGRLHWLAGKGTPDGFWEAYEAPRGQGLLEALDRPRSWSDVHPWLVALSCELAEAIRDGSLPPSLGPETVWIAGDGRAILLDFPGPTSRPIPEAVESTVTRPVDFAEIQHFLYRVATAALVGGALNEEEVPSTSFRLREVDQAHAMLAARQVLQRIHRQIFSDLDELLAALKEAAPHATSFRDRRIIHLAAPTVPQLLFLIVAFFISNKGSDGLHDVLLGCVGFAVFLGLVALLSSLLFRGGLFLRATDIAIVRRDGREASRLRAAARSFVAWCPALVGLGISLAIGAIHMSAQWVVRLETVSLAFGLLVMVAGGVRAVLKPEQGWQDQIAGTYLVDR